MMLRPDRGGYGGDKETLSLPQHGQQRMDEGGYLQKNATLMGLDPSFQGQDLGSSARVAGGGEMRDRVPEQRIGVKRERQLESQRKRWVVGVMVGMCMGFHVKVC